MDIVLWVIAVLLAVAFLGAGLMKLTQPKEKLAEKMGWAENYSPGMIKAIGALEILAAIGLILPALLDIAPVLVPLAALGLVVIMIGAVITHARRKENREIVPPLVLLLLAALVAWGRFGPYSFTS